MCYVHNLYLSAFPDLWYYHITGSNNNSDKVHLDEHVQLSKFDDPNIDKMNTFPGLLEDDSPYLEV